VCFITDVDDHVRICRFHLYAEDLQIYTVDGCMDMKRFIALVNGDLQRFWIDRVIIRSKTQVLLILRRIWLEDVSSDVILGGDTVRLSDVVKNLGWRKQVSYISFSNLFQFAFALLFSEIYV
jgi:hypothetical protein